MRRIEIEETQPVTTTFGLTLLRVVVGAIMAAHGFQKLMDFDAFQGQVAKLGLPFPEIMAPLALAGELLGGLGLIFGLLTRVAGFGVLCVMVVTIGWVNLKNGLFAENGGFEFPLTLAACALLFIAIGGGPFSLDTLLRKRAARRAIEADERWTKPPYVPVPEEALYEDAGRRRHVPERRVPRH